MQEEKKTIQQVVKRFLGENNYTMKFNTSTCRGSKQACPFLELKLFRIKSPPSDVCFTALVIFKVSINTAEPSPITGFRGVKDFFFKKRCLQSNHIEILKRVKLRQKTLRKVSKYCKGMQSD